MESCYPGKKFKTRRITKITINIKNRTFAIPAETEATFPYPKAAAINAITRKITAQANSPIVTFP
jgi:hypothetical protein